MDNQLIGELIAKVLRHFPDTGQPSRRLGVLLIP